VTDKAAERVLVVPTWLFAELGVFHGFCKPPADYLPRLLDAAHLCYRPRAEVETDAAYKQIIPYVVLCWGDQLFHYTRGSGTTEKRLAALRSVGIGGHINDADGTDPADPYRRGMLREVEEEVELNTPYTERCLGLINDDRTPVGQVHLGVVHLFTLEAPAVRRRETALTGAGFAPLATLRRQAAEFETWSQFLLDGVL
jgi:predicted NUDIX family phosphoesterase